MLVIQAMLMNGGKRQIWGIQPSYDGAKSRPARTACSAALRVKMSLCIGYEMQYSINPA